MYPGSWHEEFGDRTGHSARRILPPILNAFEVGSTLEVGCGQAHWTRAAIEAGVGEHCAVDGPWTDVGTLLIDPSSFRAADLTQPLDLPRRYDLAICLEVAEHVREEEADVLLGSLVEAADVILFGAAAKYQGGYRHVNEQRPSYWRNKFTALDYEAFDLVRPRVWTDASVHFWYRQNAFVYVSRANREATRRAAAAERAASSSKLLFDAIVPDKYELMASYEDLAFRRLLRRLPGWVTRRMAEKLRGR